MSDAIKNEAHVVALRLANMLNAATGVAKLTDSGSVDVPVAVLQNFGETAERVLQLLTSIGLIDRTRVQEEFSKTFSTAEEISKEIGPMIERLASNGNLLKALKSIMSGGTPDVADKADGEECDCSGCKIERAYAAGEIDVAELPPVLAELVTSVVDARLPDADAAPSNRVLH